MNIEVHPGKVCGGSFLKGEICLCVMSDGHPEILTWPSREAEAEIVAFVRFDDLISAAAEIEKQSKG